MTAPSHAIEIVREPAVQRRRSESALRERHLQVIGEMLGMLDTLTIAGQRHLMEKIVSFVDTQTRSAAVRMSNGNRAALFEVLTRLRQESQRLVPDPVRFIRHAENLIALLSAVRQRRS